MWWVFAAGSPLVKNGGAASVNLLGDVVEFGVDFLVAEFKKVGRGGRRRGLVRDLEDGRFFLHCELFFLRRGR